MNKTLAFVEELRDLLEKYDATISVDTDGYFKLWLSDDDPVRIETQVAPRVGEFFNAHVLDVRDN